MNNKKETFITTTSGDRIKVTIYDDLIIDHVVEGLAKSYGYSLRTGLDLSRPLKAELKEYLIKVP